MNELFLDLETFSSVDLGKCGVYKYAASPDFEVLLFAYSVDGGEVRAVDIASGEDVPDEILAALEDDEVTKWSYNVNFERVCLSSYLGLPVGTYLSPSSWRCSMIWAAYLGLPQSLAGAGAVLQVDKKKLEEGKDLIKYFCVPCKGTKVNGGRERNRPEDAPEKWELFKKYNKRDVETEMEIQDKLKRFPVPESVWEEFIIDQEINDRGILVDMEMVENAIHIDEKVHEELTNKMKELTELDNPQSVQQLKGWLADNGLEMDSLGKDVVKEAVKNAPSPLKEVLTLRQQISKSSVKKYVAMENVAGEDNRARGTFRFYGANRSGRFSGRGIQLQNLPQNHLPDLEEARGLVKAGNYEALSLLYDDIPDTLSQLIRTAFIPSKGKRYYVADFSSIEARVLSWIAGEQWRIDAFKDGKDIYCMSASSMFGVPVEKHGVNGELRAKGKVAELACGYGGSVGAMKAMGAGKMGLADDEIQEIVTAWRNASPNIVKFWWDVDRAVMKCMKEGGVTTVKCLKFRKESGMLIITLPSGRELFYVKPRIGENKFGGECVTYEGREGAGKWGRVESYGPKFVENCIAKGVQVVTSRGLVPIEDVASDDLIWDGVEWVSHEGLIYQGEKEVVAVGEIRMTSDHKILTEKGWMPCGEAEGFDWAAVPLPDSFGTGGEHEAGQSPMALPMRVWERGNCAGKGTDGKEVSNEVMWLHEGKADQRGKFDSQDESSSCVRSMALDETEMRGLESSCLSQLRCEGDNGLPGMEREFRSILAGHGSDISPGTGIGQERQRQGIQPGELSVGVEKSECTEQKDEQNHRHSIWTDDSLCAGGADRNRSNNDLIQTGTRMADRISVRPTEFKESVYDIRNCGPRHRFAVYDGGKLRIVSNCIQGISRDILCYAMRNLREYDVVAHIHDELVVEAPPETSLEEVCELMSRTPPWAEGLLLRADGFVSDFYKKDD